ncbi:MAG TPA: hypothetical protein VMH83_03890 [Candidatus Acidoferrum sp.]|nr:hypothetical protein [Candidatus Acidoferrum sp.]
MNNPRSPRFKWPLVLIAALTSQVVLLLADVIFVSYYSWFANPGHDQAFYSAFAQETAGAFVFCFAPPFLYLVTTWLCDKAAHSPWLHAMAFITLYYVLDLGIIVMMAADKLGDTLHAGYLTNLAMMYVSAAVSVWLWQRRQARRSGSAAD